MRVQAVQSSFADGQISPRMQGMIELESYKSSVAQLENFVSLPQGSITRRPGTYYASPTKNNGQARLIPFSRGQGVSAVLEIGATSSVNNAYIRIFSNDGPVFQTGTTTPVEITNITLSSGTTPIPWVLSDLIDINFTQSADVLFICHPLYPPLRLSRNSAVDWVVEYLPIENGPFQSVNTTDTKLAVTGATLSYEEVGSISPSAADQTTDTFTFNNHPFVNGQKVRVSVKDSGTYGSLSITSGSSVIRYITTATQNTFKLATSRTAGAIDLTDDPTKDLLFEKPFIPKGQTVTITASAQEGINKGDGFEVSDVGRYIRINSEIAPQIKWGYVEITARTSETVVTAEVKADLADEPYTATTNSNNTKEWALGAFSGTTGYPRAVQIYQQRLVFAGTLDEPSAIFFSKVASFLDFSTSEPLGQATGNFDSAGRSIIGEQIFEDNALSLTISSDTVDQIEWISEDRKLTIGTSGGIFQIFGSEDDVTLTPFNFSIVKASAWASHPTVLPVKIGNNLLYVQQNGRKLRELAFDKQQDQYAAADLTLRAEDISQSGFKEMSYQDQPNSVVWCLRNDGRLAALTYVDLLSMRAWHRHTLGGSHTDATYGNHAKVESIAVIPRDTYDQLYLIVKRTINGAEKRYVEFLERFYDAYEVEASNGHFVDSGLEEASGASAGTVKTGFTHLAGETVSILGDAAVQPNQVVTNAGEVTLQLSATTYRIGLPFTSTIRTLPVVTETNRGTSVGNRKRIHSATIKLLESMSFKFGVDLNDLTEEVFRLASDKLGIALSLFTGERSFQVADEYSNESQIYIVQDRPYPLTILNLAIDYETNE